MSTTDRDQYIVEMLENLLDHQPITIMRVTRMGGSEFRIYTPPCQSLDEPAAIDDDLETALNLVLT